MSFSLNGVRSPEDVAPGHALPVMTKIDAQERTAFFVLDGPLVPVPAEKQTRMAHLHGFANLLHGLGRNPISILEQYEIDAKALWDADSYISCESFLDVIDYCAATFNDTLFGLRLAQGQSSSLFGFLESLCRVAPDLRTALQCLCDYLPALHSSECLLALAESRETTELICGSRTVTRSLEQVTYGAVHSLVSLLKDIAGNECSPAYVLLQYAPGQHEVDALEKEFRCRIHVRQPKNAIAWPNQVLARPTASCNRITFRLLRDYADRVRAEQRHSLIERVKDYIRGALSNQCSLNRCACALGMSSRVLQLRLDACGLSFSQLLSNERVALAKRHLRADDVSLDELARKLGYSEQTSLGRAFRRWTGLSPGAYKAEQLDSPRVPTRRNSSE